MLSEHFKILPVLIIVAMLTFSVRLADFATGMSDLSGSAVAADDVHAKESSAGEASNDHPVEEVSNQPPEVDLPKVPSSDDAKPISIADEADAGEPDVDWRDASDQEADYTNVKMEMFDSLSKRRQGLDSREKDIQTREALLKAAEQELDRKVQELTKLKSEMERLLVQQSEEEEQSINRLVTIYEGMKPKDAARIFDTLDIDVLVAVMGRMSERKLSPILASMNAERARTVTIMLAEQKKLPELPG